MSKDLKEVRELDMWLSIGRAFLGRRNCQCKGCKVIILTYFTSLPRQHGMLLIGRLLYSTLWEWERDTHLFPAFYPGDVTPNDSNIVILGSEND